MTLGYHRVGEAGLRLAEPLAGGSEGKGLGPYPPLPKMNRAVDGLSRRANGRCLRERRAGGRRLAEVERHLLGCADCATLVALAAPTTVPAGTTLEWAGAPPPGEEQGAPRSGRPARCRARRRGARSRRSPTWEPESEPDDRRLRLRRGVPPSAAMVGRYRLLHLVGRGGMGEVYAAHDPELDRRIAIKIMRGDASRTGSKPHA